MLYGDVFYHFPWALLLRLLHQQRRKLHTQPSLHSKPFGNYWAYAMFNGPDFIAELSDGLKIIDPIFITCDEIGKLLFVTSLKHLKHLLATLTRCLFCSLVNRCGTHLATIFRTFKCFFKIKRTVDSVMPTFRAILRTAILASPSKISFIFGTISLRDANFGLPDFGAFLIDSTPDSDLFFQLQIVS